jgi:hypothetical protein
MAIRKTAPRKPAGSKTVKTAAKKTTGTKTLKTAASKPSKKTQKKKTKGMEVGSGYACSVCGLAVSVDRVCGCAEVCDLMCCGKPMKKL